MRCVRRSICPVRFVSMAAVMGGLLAAAGCLTVSAAAEPEDVPPETPAAVGTPAAGTTEGTPLEPAATDATLVEAAVTPGLRVRVKLDVSGELLAPAGPEAPPVRESVAMTARFDFEETTADTVPARPAVVRRSYRDATASMRFGDVSTTSTLAADARRLLVVRQGTTPVPYLADGFLSGEEADLLETPFDSLLLDDLLPKEPLPIGQTWTVPADVTAGLLAIDTVESGGLEARVEEVSDSRGKVTFSGIIDGAVDGVPTHLTVEGSFTVAARDVPADDDSTASEAPRQELHGRVLQASAVIRERRQASHVAPGFEVEARLLVARTELAAGQELTEESGQHSDGAGGTLTGSQNAAAAGELSRRRGDGGPGRVWYRDPSGCFDLVHDSRWRRVEEGEHGLVMRLVDRGALVGQCSITSLPQAAASPLPTREDVQRDIERSLTGQAGRSDAPEQSDRADGLRVVRLVSSGTAGRLPFRWIHYVLAAQDGSRVSVTFMCEESMLPRFGDADRPLIEGLLLRKPQPASTNDQSDATATLPAAAGQQTR